MAVQALLPIGEVATRSGLTVATLRFYEQRGLITSERSSGNKRLYPRYVLRRLAVIAAAQRVGLTLQQICEELSTLPPNRSPTQAQWNAMSVRWQQLVHRKMQELDQLSRSLDSCIGCGCLSLQRCAIFNPDDTAATEGPGSRWLRAAISPPGT